MTLALSAIGLLSVGAVGAIWQQDVVVFSAIAPVGLAIFHASMGTKAEDDKDA